MSPLEDAVAGAFAAGGVLGGAAEAFRPREGQTAMALAVARTIDTGGALVVEAGTGVGKTYAYLVPALLSGERVLVSTATKTLQDQLFGRDLPRLLEALALPRRLALLKGRASYLCLHRLEQARQGGAGGDRTVAATLARIELWAQATRSGDLAELPGLDERSPAIPLATSTRENCLGSGCPRFRGCHVHQARREALAADVVVVNHHLFFADLAVRESGMAELLPSVRVAVFDEAHQLNETGVQFLGQQLGTGQLLDFTRDLLATGLQLARGLVDWQQLAAGCERAARDLRLAAGGGSAGGRLRWSGEAPEGIAPAAWQQALGEVAQALERAAEGLGTVSEIAPDFARLQERAATLAGRARRFAGACAPGAVRWAEAGLQLRLVESPLDIAQTVRSRLLHRPADAAPAAPAGQGDAAWQDEAPWQDADAAAPAPPPEDDRRAWIFTSATLGDDAKLSWFTGPCGLDDAQVLRVGSPFDYPAQAALWLPRALPKPADPGHPAAVAALAGDAARRLGGRTMVLTTTLRALRAIGEALQRRFDGDPALEVLVQGQWPKRRLVERFREGAGPGRPGCLLVASASFWEGVDVPGAALQLVVIDKLPFPPPGDPLVEARSQRLELEGRSAFADYFIPEAAVALKQGAGRLIRSEDDRGVLVVCDTRLAGMGYGRRLLAALPPMHRLADAAAFDAALDALAAGQGPRASGTG